MSRLSLLKKIEQIYNLSLTPSNSPEFQDVPTVPELSNDNNSKQVVPVHFVKNVVNDKNDLLTNKMNIIYDKADPYNIVNGKRICSNIKDELEVQNKINGEIINNLSMEQVKIKYNHLEEIYEKINDLCDAMTNIFNSVYGSEGSLQYIEELEDIKDDIHVMYLNVVDMYNTCSTTFTNSTYEQFVSTYNEWITSIDDLELYCKNSIANINQYYLDGKANLDQDDLLDLLLENGEQKAITIKYILNRKQMYFNGDYLNLHGLRVEDDYNNINLDIDDNGDVSVNLNNFKINNVNISQAITDTITQIKGIKDIVNNRVTDELKKDIRNLEKESERLNDNYEQIENIARLDIKDDASMTSLKKFSTIIYKELTSRNSALLNELNTIINSNAVQLSYKNKLNDLKNNLTESFSQMTTKYNTFMSTPGEYNYNMFNKSIEDYNISIGKLYSYITISFTSSTTEIIQDCVDANNKVVCNILTDNGIDNALFIENDKLYFLDERIKTNDLKSENTISTPIIYTSNIKTTNVGKMMNNSKSYISTSSGEDICGIENNGRYKSLQWYINQLPDFIEGDVDIYLETSIDEDIIIKSKMGGNINIFMNNNSLYGKLKIANCTTCINLYGGSNTNDLPVAYPCVSPYSLYEDANYYFSIDIFNSSYVSLNNIRVYGKHAKNDYVYDVETRNYAIGCINSTVDIQNCSVVNSDNGIFATKMSYVNTTNVLFNDCKNYYYNQSSGSRIIVTTPIDFEITSDKYKYDDITYGQGNRDYYLNFINNGITCTTDTTYNVNEVRSSSFKNVNCKKMTSSSAISYCLDSGRIINNIVLQGRIMNSTNSIDNANKKSFWFFENQFTQLRGKEILKVILNIPRIDYMDSAGKSTLFLRYHTFNTYSEAINSVKTPKNGPSISVWNTEVDIKSLSESSDNTISIVDKEIINGIKDGVIKGFGVYVLLDNSDKYIACPMNIDVQVYYKD